MDFSKIMKPTLLLDEEKCRRNIRTMAEKARSSGVIFRPHFKTHQSIEIGNWFREEGYRQLQFLPLQWQSISLMPDGKTLL
jgi:D-serine deaminase-like pyridoxal phosphate-dependent protein